MQVREGEDSAHHGVEYMMYYTYVGGSYDATPAVFGTGYSTVVPLPELNIARYGQLLYGCNYSPVYHNNRSKLNRISERF